MIFIPKKNIRKYHIGGLIKMLVKILFLACLNLFTVDATCRALSLEGGGSRGAYEAGVLFVLANSTKAGNIQWNVVTGISIGAINAGMVSQFAMGDEVNMSKFLMQYWQNITGDSDIYIPWKGGLVDGLLFQRGIYDNSPAIELGRKIYNKPIVRNITIGSTNLDTGLFGNFNESIGAALEDGVACSASPPLFFSPHEFEGYSWSDGGCIINLDVFSAINRCLDVADESDIIVDMIYDNPYSPLPAETSFKTLEVFSRMLEIKSYDSNIWYTTNAINAFPLVNFRYTLVPSKPIPGGIVPLNFTPSVLQYEIDLGINDTLAMLAQPTNSRTIIFELFEEIKGKVIYP